MITTAESLPKSEIKKMVGHETPIIIEIGCYDGKDSAELIKQFNGGMIHCFEADPRSQELFEKNNAKYKNMFLHRMAIGNQNGKVVFHQSNSDTRRHHKDQKSWSASSSLKKPKSHIELFPDVRFDKDIKVKCIKLDTWYVDRLYSRVIDFIWCDVNGAEGDVIKGGLQTLAKHTKYLYIEFSDKELYENQIKKDELLSMIPMFEVMGIYNYMGNFGNMLLKNKNL